MTGTRVDEERKTKGERVAEQNKTEKSLHFFELQIVTQMKEIIENGQIKSVIHSVKANKKLTAPLFNIIFRIFFLYQHYNLLTSH